MEELPLYIQVRTRIKEGIEQGTIKPDKNGILPSQVELAKDYRVGLMTVKRAIKELERMGLVESRRGKGLLLKSRMPSKDQLVEDATDRILHMGVAFFDVFKSIGNPIVRKLMSGIEASAEKNNITLHTVSYPGLDKHMQEYALFSNGPLMNVDGILLLSPVSSTTLAKLAERKMPFVSYSILSDENAVCHTPDPINNSYKIHDALLSRGHRHILLFAGNRNRLETHMGISGLRMAYAKHGLSIDPSYIICEDYNMAEVNDHIHRLLDIGHKVDAIVAFDDIMAAGIYDILAAMGRNDIFVAGIGNLEEYRDKVALTLDLNLYEIGFSMTQSLVDMMYGLQPEYTKYFHGCTLIERDKE